MKRIAIAMLLAASFSTGVATAQDYPSKPVRWIVPTPPGSSTDALSRILADQLSKRFNQPFVVETKAGASGMIGAKFVADSPADGYTIMLQSTSWPGSRVFIKDPLLKVPDDLDPVSLVIELPLVLAINASVPARTLQEMLAYAKANPGKLNYGIAGAGDPTLHFERLKKDSGADIVQVAYKGAGPQTQALLANEVQMAFPPIFTALPGVQAGKLRVIAITGDKRASQFPDAPTFAELGYQGIRNVWQGTFMARGTPVRMISTMQQAIAAVVKSPEISAKFAELAWIPVGSTPEELRRRIDTDIREWTVIARDAGIKPE